MAEVLGVIASGISIGALAGQIASSVVKLKSYLDKVRDAPEDIRILIDEIGNLLLLLSDIEDDWSRNHSSAMLVENGSALRCLDRCKSAVERVQRVADDMAVNFEDLKPLKRKLISAKIIWKRDKVERYRAELANAVQLLTLSYQIYTRSLVQLQPDIIALRIAQLMQIESANIASVNSLPSSSTGEAPGSTSYMRTNRAGESSRSRQMETTWLRWKLRSLLLERAWDLEVCRSQRGWKFSISTYAVVSRNSLVFQYCSRGNIEGLQRLFSQGEASPFTVCENQTLLQFGADCGNLKLCEFLINQGADLEFSYGYSLKPLEYFVANGVTLGGSNSDSCDLAALLGSRSEITIHILSWYRGPVSVFSILLRHMDANMGDFPIKDRCDLAIKLAEDVDCSPELFLMALSCNSISDTTITTITYQDPDGKTLLHAVTGAVGQLVAFGKGIFGTVEFERRMLGWKSIILELVAGGADLQATFSAPNRMRWFDCQFFQIYRQITPLSSMLFGFFCESHKQGCNRMDPGKAMSFYITVLYDSGMNLKEYGECETLTWESLEVQMGWIGATNLHHTPYYFGRRRLLSFAYGSHPGDWRVWENEPTDEFAGDFWLMLDRKKEVMPGTWIE